MHLSKIRNYLNSLEDILFKNGFTFKHQKDLQYGIKFLFMKENQKAVVVIYYSKKKGFSFVYEGDNSFKYKNVLLGLLGKEENIDKEIKEHSFTSYVGCDESGKGDYFGPLVVGGFLYSPDINEQLLAMGIKDCKVLTDRRVLQIYSEMCEKFSSRVKYITLMPEDYNSLYERFLKENKKLNSLLGWLYASLIKDFENQSNDGFLIDRFADEKFIYNEMTDKNVNIKTIIKGESDIAVAAGSVIARAEFLKGIEVLSAKFNLKIPLGAGKNVVDFAKNTFKNFDREQISKLVKLHFKTTNKVIM